MLVANGASAGLTYNPGDMILGFRKAGGTSNLEVDLGSVQNILNIAGTGQVLTFNQFTASDITAGVGTAGSGSLNSAIWSVSAATSLGTQVSGVPAKTIWATSARGINSADINTQTTPWVRQSATLQGNTTSPILTVGSGFAAASGNAGSTTAAEIGRAHV